jgi:Flp pilus assembly protein TadG
MLTMICLFAGLAIDLGSVSQTHQNAQDSSDSAALAGASLLDYVQTGVLSEQQAVDQVENYVISNYTTYSGLTAGSSAWTNCTASIPSGWTTPAALVGAADDAQNCIALNSLTFPNIIQVALPPEKVTDVLGDVGHSQNVSAVSTAAIPATSPCGLCILNPTGTTLSINTLFDSGITVTGSAGIAVDSSSTGSCYSGTPAVDLGGFLFDTVSSQHGANDVVGSWADCALLGASVSPSPTTIPAPGVADPLSNLPVPSTSCGTDYGNVKETKANPTLQPGCYGTITADSFTGTLTMNPGIYVITGEFDYSNIAGALQGTGVMLYFTCQAPGKAAAGTPTPCASGGQAGGYFSEDSGADLLNISPPTASTCSTYNDCPYVNLTFFYDRHDTSGLTLDSGLGLNFFGTIYAPSATYATNGLLGDTQDSLVVVGALELSGDEFLNVNYNANQNVPTGQAELCNNSSTGNNC